VHLSHIRSARAAHKFPLPGRGLPVHKHLLTKIQAQETDPTNHSHRFRASPPLSPPRFATFPHLRPIPLCYIHPRARQRLKVPRNHLSGFLHQGAHTLPLLLRQHHRAQQTPRQSLRPQSPPRAAAPPYIRNQLRVRQDQQ
jgi:hypothetical protein